MGAEATAAGGNPETLEEKLQVLKVRQTVLWRETHRAQTGEGLIRAQMGTALIGAIAARLEAETDRDAAIAARFHARAKLLARPDRRNRLRALAERGLRRLGSLGDRLISWRSGLWRPGTSVVLFDSAWYSAKYFDQGGSGLAPLVHYLLQGAKKGYSPHRLFDGGYYARTNAAALAMTGLSPLEHFVRVGAGEGRNPHPLFDIDHYVAQVPELADTGENPLLHYLRVGGDVSPHRLFRARFYLDQLPSDEPCPNPLLHYLASGHGRGLKPHPLFDPAWYLSQYPAVDRQDPLSHFIENGANDLTNPGPWFDTEHYLRTRSAHRPLTTDPLSDYLTGGAWGSAEPHPGFNRIGYLANHPELAAQGVTPLEHWAG